MTGRTVNKEINWVSMQALIGGFSLGAEKAFGTPPKMIIHQGWANDKHYIKYMNEKRNLNIPIVEMNSDYVTFKTPEDEKTYNDVLQKYTIHAAIMTPVCSGLSMLNTVNEGSKARGSADNDQNQNMYALTKLGFRMGAKVVAFENAPAAYTKSGEAVIERLKEIASEKDYTTQLFRTDTLLHGIPQSRKRTFIMFYRDTNPGLFNYELKEYTPLAKYLSEVNSSMAHWHDNAVADSKDSFYDFILDYTKEKTFRDATRKLMPDKKTTTAMQLTEHIGFDAAIEWFENKANELNESDPKDRYTKAARIARHCKNKTADGKGYWDSSTYLANDGLFVNAVISKNVHRGLHPTEERGFNIRELLHLMGHPHDFEMIDAVKNWNHISQNVPVKTATFIGSQIRKYLEGELEIASTDFVKQDNIKQRLDTKSSRVQSDW